MASVSMCPAAFSRQTSTESAVSWHGEVSQPEDEEEIFQLFQTGNKTSEYEECERGSSNNDDLEVSRFEEPREHFRDITPENQLSENDVLIRLFAWDSRKRPVNCGEDQRNCDDDRRNSSGCAGYNDTQESAIDSMETKSRTIRRGNHKRRSRGRIVQESALRKHQRRESRNRGSNRERKTLYFDIRLRHKNKRNNKSISPMLPREQPFYLEYLHHKRSNNNPCTRDSDCWKLSNLNEVFATGLTRGRGEIESSRSHHADIQTRPYSTQNTFTEFVEEEHAEVLICADDDELRRFLEELQEREITPEDFDRLMELEKFVTPKTIDATSINGMTSGFVFDDKFIPKNSTSNNVQIPDLSFHDRCIICMDSWVQTVTRSHSMVATENEVLEETGTEGMDVLRSAAKEMTHTMQEVADYMEKHAMAEVTMRSDHSSTAHMKENSEQHTKTSCQQKYHSNEQTHREDSTLGAVERAMYDMIESVVEPVTVLPCGHMFHKHCIEEWLLNRSTRCPIDNLEIQS